MFLYCENEFNPKPELTLLKRAGSRGVRFIEYVGAPIYLLPGSLEAFRASKSSKYWYNLRRSERKFTEDLGSLEFGLFQDEATLRKWLPKVHALFAERWQNSYTSSSWKTKDGFQKYADALLTLSAQDKASLALLYRGDELLAFSYNLHEGERFYYYQHATKDVQAYRPYSLGKIFLVKLLQELIGRGSFRLFDFMVGEDEYKLEWAQVIQKVYWRFDLHGYSSRFLAFFWYGVKRLRISLMKKRQLKKLLVPLLIGLPRLGAGARVHPSP